MVTGKKQAARVKTTEKKATSRKSPRERARAALEDSLHQLEKRLPGNLASMARELRRGLEELQRQIDNARKDREDRWNRIEAQIRRDAARLLRRLERAVEPRATGSAHKKAARKRAAPGEAAPQRPADR
jgi:TolA-binding protein